MSSIFGPNHQELVSRYMVEQERRKLVSILQKTWPNVHLQITETYDTREVCVIINEEILPVLQFDRWELISSIEILNHINTYLTNLKKVKRGLIMKEILNIKEQ